jgi:hypothetical protein
MARWRLVALANISTCDLACKTSTFFSRMAFHRRGAMFVLRDVARSSAASPGVVRRLNARLYDLFTVSGSGWRGGSTVSSRLGKMLVVLSVATLMGCSVHPIPDDVSPIPTEEIVKSARCEMRLGLFDQVGMQLKSHGIQGITVGDLEKYAEKSIYLTNGTQDKDFAALRQKIKDALPAELLVKFTAYANAAIVYDFEFNITEDDNIDASFDFKLPFTNPRLFDLNGGASLHKTRIGNRKFKASETFASLLAQRNLCEGFKPRDQNLIYPVTGSIGLRKLVRTFVAIAEQGGGKDSFVDTLTFTTAISGKLVPTLTLNQVPREFRLVSASATVAVDRTDVHKIIVSLAFPQVALVDKTGDAGKVTTVQPKQLRAISLGKDAMNRDTSALIGGSLDDPYDLNPIWRARYNLCVADAQNREATFGTLRLSPPEVYCISYADAFVDRHKAPGGAAIVFSSR